MLDAFVQLALTCTLAGQPFATLNIASTKAEVSFADGSQTTLPVITTHSPTRGGGCMEDGSNYFKLFHPYYDIVVTEFYSQGRENTRCAGMFSHSFKASYNAEMQGAQTLECKAL